MFTHYKQLAKLLSAMSLNTLEAFNLTFEEMDTRHYGHIGWLKTLDGNRAISIYKETFNVAKFDTPINHRILALIREIQELDAVTPMAKGNQRYLLITHQQ